MSTVLPGLPPRVEVYEVGPRDGLQNEERVVPVELKAEFVPQAARRRAAHGELPGRHPVLVPTERGLGRALAAGVREVAVFAAATESFVQRHLNWSVPASLDMFAPVVARARAEALAVGGYVSMCFGDPWEGEVPLVQVADVALRLDEMGCTGGCPYARSATGNLATEDLVCQLHGLGVETGTDLDALVATSAWRAERLGPPSASRTVNALAARCSPGDPT